MSASLIIVPTYNEKDNIQALLESIFDVSPEIHVLFVDDNSPDGTGQIVDGISQMDPRVHVMHRTEKAGLGKAYLAGFGWALEKGYDFIFEMDADLSHDPASVPEFLAAAQNADLVLGSRYINGIRIMNWPLNRLILSKGASRYVRTILGMPFSDPTGGYKCFRRSLLETLDLEEIESSGYSFQIEMTYKAWLMGFEIAEVPIVFTERTIGESKISRGIIVEAVFIVWRLLFRGGFRRRAAKTPHPRSVKAVGAGTAGSTTVNAGSTTEPKA